MSTAETTRPVTGIWEKEFSFTDHWLDLGDVRLHYVDEGDTGILPVRDSGVPPLSAGETPAARTAGTAVSLLFLHGNPTWSFYWRHLISHFRKTHRCVAPDHMGCGMSDKPQNYPYTLAQHIANARALVDHLDLRDIVLVVHDWGGAIGMGLAREIPDRIKGFVICNTAAFPSRHMPLTIGLCRVPGFGALAIRGFNAFVRGALATCAKKPLSAEARAGYLAPYRSWDERVANLRFVQDIPTGPGHESWGTLKDIEASLATHRDKPMLLCWGGKDYVFDDSFYEEWRRRFPEARAEYYPDAGHFVVEDARAEVINAIEQFLEGERQINTRGVEK